MKLRKDDIYSAPPVADAFPPTVEQLLELISHQGEEPLLLFSLGNVLLREGSYREAEQILKKVLASDEFRHEVLTNIGVCCIHADKLEEALSNFRQAVLLNPQMALPHLHSGRVQMALKDFEAAETSFEKVIKLLPDGAEAFMSLAEIAEVQGEKDKAEQWYKRAFDVNPEAGNARVRLAVSEFARGKEKFVAGDLEAAFGIWSDANKQFAPAFSVEQPLVQGLQQLIKEYERSNDLSALKAEILKVWGQSEQRRAVIYKIVARTLFLSGLIPECFEPEASLAAEFHRWQESLIHLGEHPYPHFRIGLIHGYRGELVEAETEIRLCQDKLLPKKQAALKLDRVLALVMELKDLESQALRGLVEHSPDFEWEQAGFPNVFERNSWKQAAFLPLDAKRWKEAGFSAAKAKPWMAEGVSPEIAKKWTDAGATVPPRVKRWARVEIEPEEALGWERFFQDNVEQAIQCRNVGFSDPELAHRWLQVVLFPWDAIRWHELGFSPEEAKESLADGVRDPQQAKQQGYLAREIIESKD